MATFILLTRLSSNSLEDHKSCLTLNEAVADRVKRECPQVTWKANYAIFGPSDYLDVFEAPDNETAARVSLIVRIEGNATTELWSAIDWETFKQAVGQEIAGASTTPADKSQVDKVGVSGRDSFPASDPPAWTGSTAS